MTSLNIMRATALEVLTLLAFAIRELAAAGAKAAVPFCGG